MRFANSGTLKLISIVFTGAAVTVGFQACGPGFTALNSSSLSSVESYAGGSGSISINWAANREAAVNTTGGGYRVYYTQNSSLTSSAPAKDVPFSSGTTAPTTTTLSGLVSGTYNIYVVAYSAMKSAGSAASPAATVTVK